MSDPDVCIFCSASGCVDGSVEHGVECPFTTGMWPVDDEMIRRDVNCMACHERFKKGDLCAEVRADWLPTSGIVNSIVAEWERIGDVSLTLCLPCAALGKPVES